MKLLVLCISIFSTAFSLYSNEEFVDARAKEMVQHVVKSIVQAKNHQSKLNANVLSIEGFSASNNKHLLNNLCSRPGTVYFEVGTWKGSTFISALYENQRSLTDAIAVDDWSQFGGGFEAFAVNVLTHISTVPFHFFSQNCFQLDKSTVFKHPVNIFYYDGGHLEEDHEAAFTYFDDIFDDVFIAIVDDWNWEAVRQGTRRAFAKLGYEILFQNTFFTDGNAKYSWWNGIMIAVIRKPS